MATDNSLSSSAQNPLPLLSEATHAAAKIFTIGRDLAILNAELKAAEQTKRVGWATATVIFALLFLFFPIFWVTTSLHERGWSALSLAGACALLFGVFAGFSAWMTRRAFFNDKKTRGHRR